MHLLEHKILVCIKMGYHYFVFAGIELRVNSLNETNSNENLLKLRKT